MFGWIVALAGSALLLRLATLGNSIKNEVGKPRPAPVDPLRIINPQDLGAAPGADFTAQGLGTYRIPTIEDLNTLEFRDRILLLAQGATSGKLFAVQGSVDSQPGHPHALTIGLGDAIGAGNVVRRWEATGLTSQIVLDPTALLQIVAGPPLGA